MSRLNDRLRSAVWATVPVLWALSGCGTTESVGRPSLLESDTTVRPPTPVATPVSKGSLVPAQLFSPNDFRGHFEERRAARIGDTLTVILNETTKASKDGGTAASRQAENSIDLGLKSNRLRTGSNTNNALSAGLNAKSGQNFDAKGRSSQSNQFSGTITVTVVEVLANGNLSVAGEKRLAVGAEEEVIRFGGIVAPQVIQGNTVLSSQVADARIEYRGAGITDEVQRPGWLTRALSRWSPN